MATLGYVRSSNGPDLAQVGANEQLVSHVFPNTTGETLRITSISAWVGNWSGTATMRFGIWAASSSSAAPGALLARTVEFSPSTSYVDAAGGQLRTAALETPLDLAPGQVIALGVASRNASAGIAMYQASAISQPNESFYRRSISGTNMIAAGGEVTNQGQLAIYVTGTTNNPPNSPTLQSPSGETTGTVRPTLRFIHRDPDGDSSNRMQVQVQTASGSATLWDYAWNASIGNGGLAQINYAGSALLYHTAYRWRARTRDTSNEWGPWSSYVSFTPRHNNGRPNIPTPVSGTGTIHGTRTTTVSMAFTDPDWPYLSNGQAWERFEAKQVRLRRVADNVLVYNPGIQTTTASERSNRRSSTTITVPEYDVLYQWEERHRDRWGAWSVWRTTPTQIIARAGGSVDRPSSPAGRVTDLSNPGTISAVYRHSGGLSGTMWQAGLFNESGAIIATSDVFSGSSFAPGTTLNASWMFGTLNAGTVYQVRVRALATSAEGWSNWSIGSIITTNAAPNTPALYVPNADPRSLLPGLSVRVTDPDQPPHQVTVEIEVYDDTDTLLDTVNAPLNTGHSLDNLYTVSVAALEAIIPDYGTYRWRAQANDGYLDSPWSEMFTLNYYPVPEVEITEPTGPVITTSQPQLTVTTDAHTHWRIVGRNDEGDIVYDTSDVSGTLTSHTVQASRYWIGGERWNNHETFHWTAMVRSAAGLWGSSEARTLTLEYIPPDPLIVESVETMSFPGVKGTHYAVISTSQPDAIEEEFIRTIVDRVEIDGMGGNEVPGSLRSEHFVAGNSADTTFADFDMTSNQWYRYAFRYEVQSGVDVIESEPVYAEAMISFHGTLLHMPFDPLGTFVWLPYGEQQYEPEVSWRQGHSEVMTTNGRAPHGYSDSTDYVEWRCTSTLIPRDGATVDQQRDALRRMWKYQNKRYAPTGRPESVCFREGRGGDDGRVYGRMSEPVRRHSYTRLYTMDFMFRELEDVPVEGGAQ